MRIHRRSLCAALPALALLAVAAGPAAAQPNAPASAPASPGAYQAELIRDINQLERKYHGLAGAMTGKFGWRPAEGVRSVGEVLMHVSGANYLLPSMVGVNPPPGMVQGEGMQAMFAAMQEMEKQGNDEGHVHGALTRAFAHARQAVESIPDDRLDDAVKIFGQDATVRAALHLLVTHMHEHLGQLIAYARSNGVTPPWSGGGV